MKEGASPVPLKSAVASDDWGQLEGKDIALYTLTNRQGSEVKITNFGATIVSINVPDRLGRYSDIVLGYEKPEDYLLDEFYIGAVIGRYANRIAGKTVRIEGAEYQLATREGGFHLHGGSRGFNKQVFDARIVETGTAAGVRFHLLSPHLEEGFPGELSFTVTYSFSDDNTLEVAYEAISDKSTLVNFTQHSYFNLSGNAGSGILNHQLQIHSSLYLPVNEIQVPSGEIAAVEGTPFDFRQFHSIGERINNRNRQLELSGGYDHSYILETAHSGSTKHAATVWEEESGRVMDVYTTEPAVHFYSGNFLRNGTRGKRGHTYGNRNGFCLETQHFPDAPNNPRFPSTVLPAGKRFFSKTSFAFSTR